MRMLRWMSGFTIRDRMNSEHICEKRRPPGATSDPTRTTSEEDEEEEKLGLFQNSSSREAEQQRINAENPRQAMAIDSLEALPARTSEAEEGTSRSRERQRRNRTASPRIRFIPNFLIRH
ncbi:hypothetical protein M5K25_009093 [Dendrobium thyrsiflorum]|uniref:Uncharacterized protein n=1 Tax=Dendrobium thyrsiflorum TaxID=117978 RepID=A0ABD0V504_DENTH